MSNTSNNSSLLFPARSRAQAVIAGGDRRSLLLSAAVIALICAAASAQPARAQSVTGSGDLTAGLHSPDWTVGGDLIVGNAGTGTLNIANGGTVSNGTGYIGNQASGNGTITISGTDGSGHASTWTNSQDVVIGQSGAGTMNITNGGKVSNVSGYIGANGTVADTVTVSGVSADGLAATWINSGDLNIGDEGTGVLKITDGGVVSNSFGSIGNQASGNGTVLVSGTDGNGHISTWTSSAQIYVGNQGTGMLTIQGGGKVVSDQGLVGAFGGTGTAIVTGTDGNGHASTWEAANNIYVGLFSAGPNTLTVADGGMVSTSVAGGGAASVYIGYGSGTTGIVTVSSSTGDVSSLSATDRIEVGTNGAGTLTIDTGGLVHTDGDTYVTDAGGSSGTLNLLGDANGRGVLETSSVRNGTGAGVLNLDGGILRAVRSQSDFLSGFSGLTVGSEGAWFDTNGHNIFVGTAFTGSSSFNKLGEGTLVLAGDSSAFTGTTTIAAGTLRLGNGGASGIVGGNIVDNGALVFNRSDVVTFGGVISGSGMLTQHGPGTVVLTGANSYTGGTVISGGTLSGSATSFGSGAITDSAALVIDQPADADFANAIDGAGSFTKQGAGRLNYTGTGDFSGLTTVAAGLLSVNGSLANSAVAVQSGATLGGNGAVGATTILSGGAIAPGNSIGTLHINGGFTQNANSVYHVEVDPNSSASDLVQVNGSALIADGAGLGVSKIAPGNYKVGTLYTVLSATDGVTGTYALSGDTAISPYLSLKDTYDARNVYLTVTQIGDPADAASTPNQTQTATGIGSLPNSGSVGSAVLNTPDPAATRSAFDQLSGEALASAKSALISGSLLIRDTTFDRLRDVLCAGAVDETRRSEGRSRDPSCMPRSQESTVWAQGFGSWGHIAGDSNAAALSQSTGGFLVGVDIPVHDWRLGYFGGFSRTDFTVNARNSSGSSNNYHLGAYGGTQWGDLSLRLGASYSWNGLAMDRAVTVGALSNDLHANYNAGATQVFGELGRRFALAQFTLEPFTNVDYVNLRTDGFSETGGDAALTAKADTMEDTFTTVGVRPSTDISWGGFNATLWGMGGWRHAFGDVTPRSIVSFAGSDTFTITGAPIARDAGVVEAGLTFTVHGDIAAGITYGGQFSRREIDHGVRGTISIPF